MKLVLRHDRPIEPVKFNWVEMTEIKMCAKKKYDAENILKNIAEKLQYKSCGGKTIATMLDGDNIVAEGYAKCWDKEVSAVRKNGKTYTKRSDNYNKNHGALLAIYYMFNNMIDEDSKKIVKRYLLTESNIKGIHKIFKTDFDPKNM